MNISLTVGSQTSGAIVTLGIVAVSALLVCIGLVLSLF